MRFFMRKQEQYKSQSKRLQRARLNTLFGSVKRQPVEIRGKSYGLVAGHPEKTGVYSAYVRGWANGKLTNF